ncbi:hypothetical protein BAR24_00850 [Gluconobacter oxydans]|uniref:hypothetical protein n=1 Tax=Gluconobacter thailandicus TaxID=257438 RepID=UPI0002D8A9B6|nr:hypothetical protein [Gluconobacter thailandicus]ANQ40131.1 hypothetical protein BAR24_00850 [Gluconobacter oxydans]KXV35012.1 hypothetical protein AD940_04620 [Gluconobacter thailandicus]
MSDLDKILHDPAPVPEESATGLDQRPPRMWPWAILAGLLMLASVLIHVFWPAPPHKHMVLCRHGLTEHCYKADPTAEN